jgi:hypothetical protein
VGTLQLLADHGDTEQPTMRTKITIVFETHGLGTVDQHNDWSNELRERIWKALEIPNQTDDSQFPLVTFDIVSVEKLPEET